MHKLGSNLKLNFSLLQINKVKQGNNKFLSFQRTYQKKSVFCPERDSNPRLPGLLVGRVNHANK